MANRLQRDQIVVAALDAVDSPSLDQKERPGGTLTGTLGVGWLQRALDYFYKCFPIKGTFTKSAITSIVNNANIPLPADFLIDYPNGIRWEQADGRAMQSRMLRRGFAYLLTMDIRTLGLPRWYAVVDDTQLALRPLPDKVYTGSLFYYKLPAALGTTDIPPFPDDQVLTDFLEIRYKEWLQMIPKGSAIKYMKDQVAILQRAGIGPEPEPDQIELDPTYYGERQTQGGFQRDDWMGETHL